MIRAASLRIIVDDVLHLSAIKEYVAVHNRHPEPGVWTAKSHDILQKVIRTNRRLSSKKNEALHWQHWCRPPSMT